MNHAPAHKIKMPTSSGVMLVDLDQVKDALEQLQEQGIALSESKKSWVYRFTDRCRYELPLASGGHKTLSFEYEKLVRLELPKSVVLKYDQPDWQQHLISHVQQHTKTYLDAFALQMQHYVQTTLDQVRQIAPDLVDAKSAPVQKIKEQLCTLQQKEISHLEQEMHEFVEQWEKGVVLRRKAQVLNQMLSLSDYPQSFEMARALGRSIDIFVGPTNSGKSHQAFEALKGAKSGVYLAPLRLLALEGFERLNGMGVHCSLVTGEERNIDDRAHFVSSTVEMADLNTAVDVAVVDEAQLLSDADRGWAWTNAICGIPAKKLIIITAPEGLEAVKRLCTRLQEPFTVQQFERKNTLKVLNKTVGLGSIQKGDALIAFSRKEVLALKEKLASSGRTCSVIYGALAPEVRKAQAQNFAQGNVDCLIATDAIGMGLNLPIDRIVFSTTQKFNGMFTDDVPHALVRQIAGRAGRFGFSESGRVSALEQEDLNYIAQCMQKDVAPFTGALQIAPFDHHIQNIAKVLNEDQVHKILIFFKNHLAKEDPLFCAAKMEGQIEQAQIADRYKLPLLTRFTYSKVPLDLKSDEHIAVYESWLKRHHKGQAIGAPAMGMSSGDYLFSHEQHVRLLSAYCWLSYHFEDVFHEREKAQKMRSDLTQSIEVLLKANAARSNKKVQKSGGSYGPKRHW